jgi:hypothetical protein
MNKNKHLKCGEKGKVNNKSSNTLFMSLSLCSLLLMFLVQKEPDCRNVEQKVLNGHAACVKNTAVSVENARTI